MFTSAIFLQSLDNCEKGHPVTVAATATNKPLNRFNNITVCKQLICSFYGDYKNYCNFVTLCLDDDNRVVLQPITGCPDCQGDYINASYIKVG